MIQLADFRLGSICNSDKALETFRIGTLDFHGTFLAILTDIYNTKARHKDNRIRENTIALEIL
jgi:hypothetical protein